MDRVPGDRRGDGDLPRPARAAEATVLVAAFMADIGYFDVGHVLLATLARRLRRRPARLCPGPVQRRRAAARGGRLGRLWRRHEARATLLFQQRSILAITLARFISFVRTLMPWFAGMTRMSYPRFLVYDILGVAGWGVASVTAGTSPAGAGRRWPARSARSARSSCCSSSRCGVLVRRAARRRMRALVRVALTGNIASGKSAVTDVWRATAPSSSTPTSSPARPCEPGTDALRRS
jgi:hypothetical protein